MRTQPKQASALSAGVARSQHRPGVSAARLEGERWRKSSFSATAECVVVAEVGGKVALRNSNGLERATLRLSRGGLAAWVAGCRAGEFDDLTA